MRIHVNGEPREVEEGATLAVLVESMGLTGRRIAIEVNQELAPRSGFARHVLQPEDRVEVVAAIGGG